VFTLLTDYESPYHRDCSSFDLLVNAYQRGFAYTGQFCPTRERRHGYVPADLPGRQFVVCIQSHDQIGNRKFGERFSAMASYEAQKLVAGVMLLPPYVPMLFMGEEYGETASFQFFTDIGDPNLAAAVCEGRNARVRHGRGRRGADRAELLRPPGNGSGAPPRRGVGTGARLGRPRVARTGGQSPAELVVRSEAELTLAPHSAAVYAFCTEPMTNR
jgi:hypothetical protein